MPAQLLLTCKMVQYKRNLTIGRHAVEWGSQLLPVLRSCVMNVCENKISKTGNQNKICAGVKSLTAYCSMGARVFFLRQGIFIHTQFI